MGIQPERHRPGYRAVSGANNRVSGRRGLPAAVRRANNAEFIRLLYLYVLGRDGTDAEVAFQLDAMRIASRSWMAHAFLSSPEFRIRIDYRTLAMLLPATLLMRDTTETERLARVQALESGTTVRTLIE